MFVQTTHDEVARFDFLTRMNLPLSQSAFVAEHGRAQQDRHEVRHAMQPDLHYQLWSALRRNTMERRQQAGRSVVLRKLGALRDAADKLNEGASSLQLDERVEQPLYPRAVDTHCMPGSYHTAVVERDIAPGANYDAGLFVTTAMFWHETSTAAIPRVMAEVFRVQASERASPFT